MAEAVVRRLSCLVAIGTSLGHRQFMDHLPNGHAFEGEWPALGHVAPLPADYHGQGFPRNPFGVDFSAAGFKWTRTLCEMDSDGDGLTNGQELGDALCLWTVGAPPPASRLNISHPGLPHVRLGQSRQYWESKRAVASVLRTPTLRNVPRQNPIVHGFVMSASESALAPDIFYYEYVLIPLLVVAALTARACGMSGATAPRLLPVCVVTYLVCHVGVFVGNHRCYSHHAFRPTWAGHQVLGLLSAFAAQGPAVAWAFFHRIHHQYCEQELDVHSPQEPHDFFWAQGGYLVSPTAHVSIGWNSGNIVPDILDDTEIPPWNRHILAHLQMHVFLMVTMACAFGVHYWHAAGGSCVRGVGTSVFCALAYYFFLPVSLGMQITQLVNSAVHLWGDEPFHDAMSPPCSSKNNAFLMWPMLGENWHNNHHGAPGSYTTWVAWYQVDFQGLVIRAFYHLGLAHDVRHQPPVRTKEGYVDLQFASVLCSWALTIAVWLFLFPMLIAGGCALMGGRAAIVKPGEHKQALLVEK